MHCKNFCIKLLVNTSLVYIWVLFDCNSYCDRATNSYFDFSSQNSFCEFSREGTRAKETHHVYWFTVE